VVLAENAIEHVVRFLEILTLRCDGAKLDEPVSKYQRRVQKGGSDILVSVVECRTAIDLSPICIAHRLVPRLRPESSLVPLLP
jgi:hypothetical protein